MAQRAIKEYDAKCLLDRYVEEKSHQGIHRLQKKAAFREGEKWHELLKNNPWLKNNSLVIKPDILIGRRNKNNLLLLDIDEKTAKKFTSSKTKKNH